MRLTPDMARRPRRILPGRLYEMTQKTFQDRYLLLPDKQLNRLLVGVLARAQQHYGMKFCYVTLLSNHLHGLVVADSAEQVARLLCFIKTNMAKEVGKRFGWTDTVFGSNRMDITEVADDPQIQLERVRYFMEQGVKEGLVPHPTKWPGVESATAWCSGRMLLRGTWINRSELYELERNGRRKVSARRQWMSRRDLLRCTERVELKLTPPPALSHFDSRELARCARRICRDIVKENQELIARIRPGWRQRLTAHDMFAYRPESSKRGAAPRYHAATQDEWVAWVREYDDWWSLYEKASRRLRAGIAAALHEFPVGGFVPVGLWSYGSEGLPPPRSV